MLNSERLRARVRPGLPGSGYLTHYTAYGLATGQLSGEIGESFTAGRMGDYSIEEDPGRPGSKRILMGPFTVYTADNVEAAAQ